MKHIFPALACSAVLLTLFSCQDVGSSDKASTTHQQESAETSPHAENQVQPGPGEDADHDDPIASERNVSSDGESFPQQEPASAENQQATAPPKSLRIVEGKFFAFGLAEGWRVTEDGQFAVVTVAPDNKAMTIMVGNAGMPVNYPPARYVYERLASAGFQQISMGQGREARPIPGCNYAYEFDFKYTVSGIPCLGSARCHIATSYDLSTMVMTAAASAEEQWNAYRSWLPEVAALGQALNGAAFGARGIMEQNLRNSTAFADAARSYREWSQKNWQEVTNDRNRSVDQRNEQFREHIGGVQTYINPYDPGRPVEMSNQYKYYWIDRNGRTIGTNDPSENPNIGSTQEWVRMKRKSGG